MGNTNETPQAPLTTAELEAKVAELEKNNEQLAQQKIDLLMENEQLKEVNEGLQSEIEKLSEKIPAAEKAEEKKAAVLSTETFTHKGSKYGFNYPVMMFEGNRITNDDVLADKDLQAKLVAAGSSMLKKV
jgi:septal ring factor EnvC (AmiA/AmiB activator)